MVNELLEAKNQSELNRVTNRWLRYELIVIDEMAYGAMPESAVELLFQVISGRAEGAAVIITTNLPFSEWTTMFPNARLCKAMLDRLTDQAHIIETGSESYRFPRTLEKKKGSKGWGREHGIALRCDGAGWLRANKGCGNGKTRVFLLERGCGFCVPASIGDRPAEARLP